MEYDSESLAEGFYIENNEKTGWFLFDFGHKGDILHLIWSTKVELCKYWVDRNEVEKLLEYSGSLHNRAEIVDLTKGSGYNGYFK